MNRAAKKGRSILGIEINSTEIRVVEMEGVWPDPRILRADAIPTPPETMDNGEICRPDVVGRALGALLNRMGVRTRTAVMSIPSGAVATRILDIPHIPEEELLSVVRGEMLHQNILPNPQGEFDFLRLDTGDPRPQARPRLLLMAAEERVLEGYRLVALTAGVHLVGLEPGLVAMYRAASTLTYSCSPCLCLMVGTSVSEVAIMDQGPIRLYRRIDMGSRQLLPEISGLAGAPSSEAAPAPRGKALGEEEENSWMGVRPASDPNETTGIQSLAVELQRSLDYYEREYPDAPPIHNIVIITGLPALEPLANWLSETLHITTVVATMPATAATDLALRSRLDEPTALRFLRASGLAMQALEQLPAGLPQFDLQGTTKESKKHFVVSGRLTFALAFSILVLMLGSFNVFRVGQQANQSAHELDHAQEDRQELRFYRGMPLDEVRRQKEVLNLLQPTGESLPGVVDAMAHAVPPDTSLMEITREKGDTVNLSGETSSDTILVQFLDALRKLPPCSKVSLETLNRTSAEGKNDTLHYQIAAHIR